MCPIGLKPLLITYHLNSLAKVADYIGAKVCVKIEYTKKIPKQRKPANIAALGTCLPIHRIDVAMHFDYVI
jgi:hypothetical protein